jgi:hypothetical protein
LTGGISGMAMSIPMMPWISPPARTAKITISGVYAEAAAHDHRHEDVTLDLLDEHEGDDHPERREWGVEDGHDGRGHGGEHGAEVGDRLHEGRPDVEEERVAGARREGADHAEGFRLRRGGA